jgi:ATP-dependent DNA helicase DinG
VSPPPVDVRAVLGPGGALARAHPRWEPRAEQLEMAEAVAAALRAGGSLAVEAPTGVGKTLGYLVPALLDGRRVIVSTHTKTLQEQIVEKDLPILARALAELGVTLRAADLWDEGRSEDDEARWALMKGRGNYLCLDRLDRQRRQGRLAFAQNPDDPVDRIAGWARETESGDRSELSWLAEDNPLWAELDARAEICQGKKCARYDDCFVVRMRRRAAVADVIVVNHHLLLADLALKAEASLSPEGRSFGEVIPKADALIIDEAHALEEIASDYFGGDVSSRRLERLAKDAAAWVAFLSTDGRRHPVDDLLLSAAMAAEAVFRALPDTDGRVRLDDAPRFREARRLAPPAAEALEALAAGIELRSEGVDPVGESIARRARDLGAALGFVLGAAEADYVYWVDKRGRSARLGASPIEVAPLLREHLFGRFDAVVMTSATLTTRGDRGFGYFLGRIGAPASTDTQALGSPFDYPRQVALYLPPAVPEPNEPGFLEAACAVGEELIELVGGGAFFLFTSHRMMRAACERLRPHIDHPVLLQGEAPKAELLRAFVRKAPAVLFATASFWEGVDVPGDPLRLVIIDRLPFAAPTDPVVAARAARIEARGHSPFATYQVPQAILRLKQGFGRLVRTRDDRGVVALLDRRVRTKAYGRQFLNALPPATRVSDPEHLRRWLRETP